MLKYNIIIYKVQKIYFNIICEAYEKNIFPFDHYGTLHVCLLRTDR